MPDTGADLTAGDAEATARRVDELLAELRSRTDPRAAAAAEELTRCLVQLYGAGLARIMARIGPDLGAAVCADPLVESLLLVHDLHPLDAETRIRRAVERAGEVRHLRIDEAGVAHLRLTPGGSGCRSSRQAVLGEVEALVRQAAPEVTDVEVEIPAPGLPLLQVSLRPGLVHAAGPAVVPDTGS